MQRWEYFIAWVDISASSELDQANVNDYLNRLGEEEWELTGTVQDEIGRYAKFIFKRPVD
jgi:hypothetical protein